MDLLLFLISKEEVDIREVSISRIVDQYLEYLEKMRERNMDVTSDFLVMASTLMLIKSKNMLPTEEVDLEEEIDQQDELIQHLLEYKKIKMLSRGLRDRADHQRELIPRPGFSGVPADDRFDLEEVNLWDLIRAFARIMRETGLDRNFEVIHSERPLSSYIASILDLLGEERSVPFESLFIDRKTRSDAICHFVGLLELVKRSMVVVAQEQGVNAILVTLIVEPEVLASIKEDGVYHIHRLDEGEEPEDEEIPREDGNEKSAESPNGEDAASTEEAV